MSLVEKYYAIEACIKFCKTIGGLAICEEMINTMPPCGMVQRLAEEALQKRISLLTTIYTDEKTGIDSNGCNTNE